jgi:hypothetical protein
MSGVQDVRAIGSFVISYHFHQSRQKTTEGHVSWERNAMSAPDHFSSTQLKSEWDAVAAQQPLA